MRDLKTLAMQAKNRLKGLGTNANLKVLKGGNSDKIKIIIKEEDNQYLYDKFKYVVMDDCIHNPIGCMMDKKIYNELCEAKKEQYFFDTLENYNKLRKICLEKSQGELSSREKDAKRIIVV